MRNIETFPSKQIYPYPSLVERKEAEFYHNIDRRRYWFGSNDLFSSLFPDNCWCPCKARNSRIISNINIVMSVVRFYFASYWKPHVPWRPRNNWGECLCTLSDPRTRTSINWSTPSPSPHPLLPTPTHISFATLGTIGCKANKLRSLRDVECKRLIDQQESRVAFSFDQQQ